MPTIRLSVRELVEFLLRTGSIDSRFTGFDRANEGARIHRRLQKAAGEGYAAEVFLTAERTMEGIGFTIEGRADGIFTDEDGTVVIDEIKTTAAPTDAITEDMNPCHWAQGMVYGAICAEQRELETLDVRLTYYQIDTDEIIRYTRHFSAAELDAFLNDLLRQYLPWARRQLDWVEARNRSLGALQFPFPAYRPGQRALAGEVYRACAAGKAEQKGGTRLFCQAPTGIGKTMSALFPALKAMGEGKGEKIFYLTARNTTQAAAEDALARLRAADPALSLRSVTLSAKEKACLCKDAEGRPACLPEACPYANGYYERLKDALADLLEPAFKKLNTALHIPTESRGWHVFRIVRTFIIVNIGWYFDRNEFVQGCIYLHNTFTNFNLSALAANAPGAFAAVSGPAWGLVIISTLLVFAHSVLKEQGRDPYAEVQRLPLALRWGLYYLVIFMVLLSFICVNETVGFLYANF